MQSVDALCTQVDRQAHAQIAVVTIKTIDGDQSIEEFATALEDKWKVGAKGTDRGVLMLLVMSPAADASRSATGSRASSTTPRWATSADPWSRSRSQGDYNRAVPLGVRADCAGHRRRRRRYADRSPCSRSTSQQPQPVPVHLSLWQVVLGGGGILLRALPSRQDGQCRA